MMNVIAPEDLCLDAGRKPVATLPCPARDHQSHQDDARDCCPVGTPAGRTVRDVLDKVAAELAELARLLDRFETEVGPRILEAAARDLSLVVELQSLDEIGQRVSGLVAFLAALAPTAASRCRLDPGPAAERVTLAAMAARLGFREDDLPPTSQGHGDCELL
jgi:hypothetical protein